MYTRTAIVSALPAGLARSTETPRRPGATFYVHDVLLEDETHAKRRDLLVEDFRDRLAFQSRASSKKAIFQYLGISLREIYLIFRRQRLRVQELAQKRQRFINLTIYFTGLGVRYSRMSEKSISNSPIWAEKSSEVFPRGAPEGKSRVRRSRGGRGRR